MCFTQAKKKVLLRLVALLSVSLKSNCIKSDCNLSDCEKGLVLINLYLSPPPLPRRLYTAEQSLRSSEINPDTEGSVPQSDSPVPDPVDLHSSSDSGKQTKDR